jgi:hypothetical protein
MEILSVGHYYEYLVGKLTTISDKGKYIRTDLIPRMDRHRGRTEPSKDAFLKLLKTDDSKPGELVEFMVELMRGNKGTASWALEIADVVYYMENPSGRKLLYENPTAPAGELKVSQEVAELIEGTFGVSLERAREFCILKYETRMDFDRQANFKEIEEQILERFLRRQEE